MRSREPRHSHFELQDAGAAPLLLMGVTDSQTCMVLGPRIRVLREAGFRVVLVASPGELLDRTASAEGIDREAIPMVRGFAPFSDLVSLVRLWLLLGRLKPDIVEFSTPKAGLLGNLAAALRRIGRRVYLLRGLRLETSDGLNRPLLLVTERIAAACAHVVLCNSESLRARARKLSIASAAKLLVLGEGSSKGVNPVRFSPGESAVRARLGWSDSAPVLGYVGRFTRDKGVPELVEAFDAILLAEPRARLLMVGWFDRSEDALDASLRNRIENHPHIRCTGMVEDTAPYYRAMNVMVLPTWREGFPNAVLEAQATGIPVVTTFSTGARDSVVPEVTGLLIPPGSPLAICEAVLGLLRHPEQQRRMGAAARYWVGKHYGETRVLRDVADFYRKFMVSADSVGEEPLGAIHSPITP